MFRSILLWVSENHYLNNKLPKMEFVKRARSKFMPGETLEEALQAASELENQDTSTVFTLLGESVEDLDESRGVVDHYKTVLREVRNRNLTSEISLKLTQIGVDLGSGIASDNLREILELAQKLNLFVWIDIEGSYYTDTTIDIYKGVARKYSNVGICLQAYLYRTTDDIQGMLALNPAIRLVKGAYLESEEIAFPQKKDVDHNYLKLADELLVATRENEARAVFATHDSKIIDQIMNTIVLHEDLSLRDLEIHMLYGISKRVQESLLANGVKVAVLIAYGSSWFPWYMRRLAERPANLWFLLSRMIAG